MTHYKKGMAHYEKAPTQAHKASTQYKKEALLTLLTILFAFLMTHCQ